MRERIAENLIKIGCITFCITLPLSNQLNNISIGLIILACLLEGRVKEKLTLLRSALIVPITFYLLHVLGLAYTSNWSEASTHLEAKASLLLLPFFLGTTFLMTVKTTRLILKSFVLTNLGIGLFCFVMAFMSYKATGKMDHFFYHSLTEVIDLHAIYFALYLSLSVLIILYFEVIGSPLFSRSVVLLLVISFLIWIIFLAALVVMVILPLLMLYIFATRFLQNWSLLRRVGMMAGALLLFGAIAYSLPYTRSKVEKLAHVEYEMGFDDYKWTSITIRLAKWTCAKEVIQQNWLAGVGTGDGQDALMESYRRNGFKEGLRNNYNTHNQYLETWIMLGIPGIAWLLFMLWPNTGNVLWSCFLVLMGFSLLTENMFDAQKGVVFFSYFYSLLAVMRRQEAHSTVSNQARRLR